MRQTFELQADGTLAFADEQAPLVMTDAYFGTLNQSSVKQESDLAPYKPHTDVIVIANAYAPSHAPMPHFTVGLKITGKPVAQALPPPPRGLNPLQSPSPERMDQWRQECARIQRAMAQETDILHKQLIVCGPRRWRKAPIWQRALTLFALPQWRLGKPSPISELPLRYEYAYGGENKILADDDAAPRIKKEDRLPPSAAPLSAIAHTICRRTRSDAALPSSGMSGRSN